MGAWPKPLDWVDNYGNPAAVKEIGASQEFVMERLYVVAAVGATRIGAEA